MNKRFTALLLGATFLSTSAFAGGVDNAGQSVNILFEDGRYIEFSLGYLNGDVTGVDLGGANTNDISPRTFIYSGAYKADINDQLSYAFIVDQPYGREVIYDYTGRLDTSHGDLDTVALTGLLRYKFNENFSLYGGLRAQQAKAEVGRRLRAVPFIVGYEFEADTSYGLGYVVGAAYEIPDYAIRLAVTYSSKIRHSLKVEETITTPLGATTTNSKISIETPQSLNVDLQFPVSKSTLVFGGLRWVDWKGLDVAPPAVKAATGRSLLSYESNTVSYRLGVAQKFNENWTGLLLGSYEARTNDEAGTFGPTDGYISAGIGAIYTRDKLKITGAINYSWLGDSQGSTVGNFEDNTAVTGGLKIGYSF